MGRHFGGALDLELIGLVVQTVVESTSRAWLKELAPDLPKMAAHTYTGPDGKPLEDTSDLDVAEVNSLVHWAEEMKYTPGFVHGDRRRAAGRHLIRVGIEVLRGRVRTPDDLGKRLRKVSIPP